MGKYHPVDEAVIIELKQIVGEKFVWSDRDKMEPYSHDEVTGEKYIHYPEAVVLPENAGQVADIIKLANRCMIPIVPRGAGTGYACASVAYEGGIVLSTERMTRVIEVDEENMVLVVAHRSIVGSDPADPWRLSSQPMAAYGHSQPTHCARPWKRMKRPCSQACRLWAK